MSLRTNNCFSQSNGFGVNVEDTVKVEKKVEEKKEEKEEKKPSPAEKKIAEIKAKSKKKED